MTDDASKGNPERSDAGGQGDAAAASSGSSSHRVLWRSGSPEDLLPPSVDESAAPDPATWERYEYVALIGSGGMAEVYKAYDPQLKRHVALKFLRVQHPALTARLLREAQMQARVEHPNVCRVYEVGEMAGRPYIAMQLVEGETLGQAAGAMRLEQAVMVAKTVAEALHAAHREGLIHRDLKPGNVLVQPTEDGMFVPYVTDFGLAREMEAPSLSSTGTITGTPHYMAPEQVRGDASALDRRTDVYGLGATLYELLAHRPPFEGGSAVDVMVKVLADAPAPLRQVNPAIPADLDTVVAKCLEKEPQRRYDSAKALAEDLGRFLDGDPVLAARPTLAYRLWKKAQKNRALTAVAAVSTAAVLALAGLWLLSAYRAGERARLAQRFGAETGRLESTMRYAHLLPLHDTRPERALVEERIRAMESEIRGLGATAEAPGNSAIGRAFLALGRPREARDRLLAAWNAPYPERGPATAYALGVALGKLYEAEAERASRIPNKELREARLDAAAKELRAPALKYLEQSLGSRLESPAYAHGLIALNEQKYDEAVAQARRAIQEVPWLYEALQLEGNAFTRRGQERQNQGDLEGAAKDYLAAQEAFARALSAARSDPSLLLDEGYLHLHVMTLEAMRGLPAEDSFRKTLESANRALAADPDSAGARNLKAHALWEHGQRLADRGEDPSADYAEGIEAALSASRIDPQDHASYFNAGSINVRLGEYQSRGGQDPRPAWRRSIELNEKALALSPGDAFVLNSLGLAHWRLGDYEAAHGRDPREELDRAAEAFGSGLSVHPLAATQTNLGNVLLSKAMWEMEQGADATGTLSQAVAAYEKAVEINPKLNQVFSNMGSARFMQAEQAMNLGRDPRPFLEGAVADLRRAIALTPTRAPAFFNLSTCLMVDGIHGMKREGLDPTAKFAQAAEAVEKALALRPGYYDYVRRRGELDTYLGRWEMRAGRSPEALFRSAGELLKTSLAANGENLETWRNVAELCQARADWRAAQGKPAAAEVREGLAAVDRQLALNPKSPHAWLLRGALQAASARWEKDPARKSGLLQQARQAYAKAVEINPSLKPEADEGLAELEKFSAAVAR